MPALSEVPATYRSSAYPISSILALAVFREVRHDPGRIVRARGLFWLSGCNIPDVRGTPRGSVGALAALAEAIGAPSATMRPADGPPPVPNGGAIT